MLRVLDLPGVRRIEDRYRLNARAGLRATDFELDDLVAKFVRETLGIDRRPMDVLCEAYEADDLERDDTHDEFIEAANDLLAGKKEQWALRGWDVADESGRLLLCLGAIEAALECIARGLAGTPKVELEAAIWAQSKAAGKQSVSEGQRARNKSFLQLGVAKRAGERRAC